MASSKSVSFNDVPDVAHYEAEEDAEDFGTCETWGYAEEDDSIDWFPLESSDSALSDVVAAVYRAKKLRASVEQDLRRSSRSEAYRSCHTGGPKLADHNPIARRSTSLIGQLWHRFRARSNLGTCGKQDKSAQQKNAHGRRRWGVIELFQGKHHIKNNEARKEVWEQALCGVVLSDSQKSAVTDTPVAASVSASSLLLPSSQSQQKKPFGFRTRVCPEVPL